jgi:hypothetical protein
MNTMKLHLLLMSYLCSLLTSCTGTNYQTTASLLSSLSQSAATVLAARYQAASPSGYAGGGGYNQMPPQGYAPSYGGYDYSQQMPSQQGYAPNYGGSYYQAQSYSPPPQPMPSYYPAYY